MRVKFLPDNIEVNVKDNCTVLEAAIIAGVNINGSCTGKGICGKCKVKILEGDLTQKIDDYGKLTENELKNGFRLACRHTVSEGMVILTASSQSTIERKRKILNLPKWFNSSVDNRYKKGIAVDIGTTTMVVMLWDLKNNVMLEAFADSNPQGLYGADVISRINYIMENDNGLENLQTMVIDKINFAVEQFQSNGLVTYDEIDKYVVVGNTTMSHIFLGYNPSSLAAAPFLPSYYGFVDKKAIEHGLRGNEKTSIQVLPNLAGHVGSDITAGILTTDLMKKDDLHLFIDIGTNGEIVLTGKGKALTCSTAAGPAFEGSYIKYGMRADEGAIEKVNITDEDVEVKTIGDKEAIGICGSGIIDAVAELVKIGIVNKMGRILKKDKLMAKGIKTQLLERIIESEDGVEFVLVYMNDGKDNVVITQKDIREVQLAKSAIAAGVKILMNKMNVKAEELSQMSIAGAFGNFINITSAITMGLLPKIDEKNIFLLGNAAGIGASMVLLSDDEKEKVKVIEKEVEHVELSNEPLFQEEYVKEMNFNI